MATFCLIFSTNCNVLKPSGDISGSWECQERGGFLHFSLHPPPFSFPLLPFFSFSFLFSQQPATIRVREPDREAQLTSREEPSVLSGFRHIDSEKTREPLGLTELTVEESDFGGLMAMGTDLFCRR